MTAAEATKTVRRMFNDIPVNNNNTLGALHSPHHPHQTARFIDYNKFNFIHMHTHVCVLFSLGDIAKSIDGDGDNDQLSPGAAERACFIIFACFRIDNARRCYSDG